MQLSKTNFLHYLCCSKSLWLFKNKPNHYPIKKETTYEDKLALEGYEVQKLVQLYFSQKENAYQFYFEKVYKTKDGLYAVADIVSKNENGTVNIYEVKSSGTIDDNHFIDATFQTITIEKTGVKVESIYIVHLNKDYIRGDTLKIDEMMIFELVTKQVRNLVEKTKIEIENALTFLNQPKINEVGCSCLELTRSHHCDTFEYFNSSLPQQSIYILPRIGKKKLKKFVNEGRFNLKEIKEYEVSSKQLKVLKSANSGYPVINQRIIDNFYKKVKYPLYFLDYETFSSAIPISKGIKPHSHIPFQFSIHLKLSKNDPKLIHYDYLANRAELPLKLIEKMETIISPEGTIISWHKSFENTRNKEMGILYPDKKCFLEGVSNRTIDLEDIFKDGYVDIKFGGSTSIKKVLPVIVPELNYDSLAITSGTDAMKAFKEMLEMPDGKKKKELRNQMLKYCKLDTLAMVRIFKEIEKFYNKNS